MLQEVSILPAVIAYLCIFIWLKSKFGPGGSSLYSCSRGDKTKADLTEDKTLNYEGEKNHTRPLV